MSNGTLGRDIPSIKNVSICYSTQMNPKIMLDTTLEYFESNFGRRKSRHPISSTKEPLKIDNKKNKKNKYQFSGSNWKGFRFQTAYIRIARNLITRGVVRIIKYHSIPNCPNFHFNNMFFRLVLPFSINEIQKAAIVGPLAPIKTKIRVSNEITVNSSIFC